MIVIDVETTGVDFQKNSIVSIGAVDMENPEVRFYEECRIWDGAHIEDGALAVNGYSREELVDPSKQTEQELVKRFFEWIAQRNSRLPVAHNPLFDLGFLREGSVRAHVNYPFPARSIDIHSVCATHMILRGVTLPIKDGKSMLDSGKVMEYVGIPAEPKPHIALNGALWEAEALSRLLYTKNLLPQFSEYPLLW